MLATEYGGIMSGGEILSRDRGKSTKTGLDVGDHNKRRKSMMSSSLVDSKDVPIDRSYDMVYDDELEDQGKSIWCVGHMFNKSFNMELQGCS